jgi:hypothetical protein
MDRLQHKTMLRERPCLHCFLDAPSSAHVREKNLDIVYGLITGVETRHRKATSSCRSPSHCLRIEFIIILRLRSSRQGLLLLHQFQGFPARGLPLSPLLPLPLHCCRLCRQVMRHLPSVPW